MAQGYSASEAEATGRHHAMQIYPLSASTIWGHRQGSKRWSEGGSPRDAGNRVALSDALPSLINEFDSLRRG